MTKKPEPRQAVAGGEQDGNGGNLRKHIGRALSGGTPMTAAVEGTRPLPAARRIPARLLRSEAFQGFALISPTFLYALVLLAMPILIVIAHSFWTQNYLTIDRTFTLEQYRIALTEPIYRDLLFRSLYISLVVSIATVVLAYPIAYYISFHGGRHKSLWLFLITIPFWTSYLLGVMSWKVILGYGGVLNSGLMGLGIIDEPLTSLLYNSNAVIITLTHAWAAFAILPIYVSLEKVDRSLIEAATDLGDSALRRFLRITLPLSMPGVIGAAILIFVPTTGDYVTPALVGGTQGSMIANLIEVQFVGAGNWPLGAALSLAGMAMVAVIAGLFVMAARAVAKAAR